MQVNIKLKDASIDKLVKQMTIIVDSREQENKHITSFFDQKKIPYIVRKLNQGDYSAFLSANPELGLPFDISLENVVTKMLSLVKQKTNSATWTNVVWPV